MSILEGLLRCFVVMVISPYNLSNEDRLGKPVEIPTYRSARPIPSLKSNKKTLHCFQISFKKKYSNVTEFKFENWTAGSESSTLHDNSNIATPLQNLSLNIVTWLQYWKISRYSPVGRESSKYHEISISDGILRIRHAETIFKVRICPYFFIPCFKARVQTPL